MRKNSNANLGIQVTGGSLNAGAVAVGNRSTAISGEQTLPIEQIRQSLASLTLAIQQHAGAPELRDDLRKKVDAAQAEANLPRPSGHRLAGMAEAIAKTAGSIAPVVELATKLAGLLPH